MTGKDILDEKIIKCLCDEYQSIWTIDVETDAMELHMIDASKTGPQLAEMASNLSLYEQARLWYCDDHVKREQQEYARYATSKQHILEQLEISGFYYVEFVRVIDGINNYNQLYYGTLEKNDSGITKFLLGFRDIDGRTRAETDSLTGLFNRDAFLKYTLELIHHYPDRRFSIVISDIVDFKSINQRYGTEVGDKVLMSSAEYLRKLSGPGNVIGRYGGDQFAIVIDEEAAAKYLDIAENEFEVNYDKSLPPVTFKYGVYKDVTDKQLISVQCDNARLALNSIKHKYGQRVAVYDDKLRAEIELVRKIEENMRDALEERQFKVYYQPKHDALTGRITGAEALVRWIHPEYGFMSPADFIPTFERNGFITEVDDYVWLRTCENMRRWMDKGIDVVPISVNKSKLAFKTPHLLERIDKPARKFKIPKNLLHIEITESLMAEDVDNLVKIMEEIKAEGYKFDLDDFGAGYSSINILSTLPLDVVKLDMSFIKQFGIAKRIKVLAACINLAKNLGYSTISEGVETLEQINVLRTLGVDEIQGYFYSKPLPEEEFEQYLINELKE